MRLWSIHPRYLDSAGLVALWREALLAKHVLQGRTRGYRHHPQLDRFRSHAKPIGSMNRYLHVICAEASSRGYSFNRSKVGHHVHIRRIPVSSGQLAFELAHLRRKLKARNKDRLRSIATVNMPVSHPLFKVRKGPIEAWERPGREQFSHLPRRNDQQPPRP